MQVLPSMLFLYRIKQMSKSGKKLHNNIPSCGAKNKFGNCATFF